MVWFSCETFLSFCFILPGLKSSLVYIIFWMLMQSPWSLLLLICCTCTSLLSSMPFCNLHRRNTSVLFTLGNRFTSCYVIHAIHTTFPLEHMHPLYFRKQVYPFMLTTKLTWHVKGFFWSISNSLFREGLIYLHASDGIKKNSRPSVCCAIQLTKKLLIPCHLTAHCHVHQAVTLNGQLAVLLSD